MGSCFASSWSHRGLSILVGFLFLFLCSIQVSFWVEGRATSKLLEMGKVGNEKVLVRARIGSRPPSCERRCSSCGHCEAVQVPAVPQDRSGRRHSSTVFTLTARAEDTSNYKPMNWKCKCGNMILNP